MKVKHFTFSINNCKPISTDSEVTEYVDGSHVGQRRDREVLAGRVSLTQMCIGEQLCTVDEVSLDTDLLTDLRVRLQCN